MLTTTVCVVHYKISDTDDKGRNGVYVIPFRYFADTDVRAVLSDSTNVNKPKELEYRTDFTVTSYEDDLVPLGSGKLTRINDWDFSKYDEMTIYRETENTQPVDLLNGTRINADNLEWLLDRLYARMQELRDYQLRSVHVAKKDTTIPPTDGADEKEVYQFGSITERSSSFLFFDKEGKLGSYPVAKYEQLVEKFENEITILEKRAEELLKITEIGLMTNEDLVEVMA